MNSKINEATTSKLVKNKVKLPELPKLPKLPLATNYDKESTLTKREFFELLKQVTSSVPPDNSND